MYFFKDGNKDSRVTKEVKDSSSTLPIHIHSKIFHTVKKRLVMKWMEKTVSEL